MKKLSIVLFVLFFATMTHSFAQTAVATTPSATPAKAATADFFAGKWDVVFIGTPNGDAKLVATFTRKDGKLTGELKGTTEESKETIPMTNVEEESNKISFGFSAQGYDLTLSLEKVDDDNLKGMLMNMFESKAVRIKE